MSAWGHSRGGARGFTLLEVMVALALLAAALMALSDLLGNAIRNHVYARDLSSATLLARGKLAELEQKYDDQGFRDQDETEEGDFAEAGRAEVRWRADLVKPDPQLTGDQLVSMIGGAGADPSALLGKLMGGAGASAAAAAGAAAGGPTTGASPLAGMLSGMLQTQLTVLGETVKRSLRELRLTVSWTDGRTPRGFTVTTHLLVLNPKAPGGARGDNPEVPQTIAAIPGMPAGSALGGTAGSAAGDTSRPSATGTPGLPRTGDRR